MLNVLLQKYKIELGRMKISRLIYTYGWSKGLGFRMNQKGHGFGLGSLSRNSK